MACAPTPCPPNALPDPVTEEVPDVPASSTLPDWDVPTAASPPDYPRPEDPAFCAPPYTYYNTLQSYTDTCPDGSEGSRLTITVIVPPFTYSSTVDQATADAEALAYATAQVAIERALYPCVPGAELISTENNNTITTEDGRGISTT